MAFQEPQRLQPMRSCKIRNVVHRRVGECTICLLPLLYRDLVNLVPCTHFLFHELCIRTWLVANPDDPTCPLCRIQVLDYSRIDGSIYNTVGAHQYCSQCEDIHRICATCNKGNHDQDDRAWPERVGDDTEWVPQRSLLVTPKGRRCLTRSVVKMQRVVLEVMEF
jgi:hypothetical protein